MASMEGRAPQGPDRRRFLKTASALAAGLALGAASCGRGDTKSGGTQAGTKPVGKADQPSPPEPPPAKQDPPQPSPSQAPAAPAVVPAEDLGDELRVALIGCGMQGSVLLASILKENALRIRFRALCDLSEFQRNWRKGYLNKVCQQDVTGHVYEDYRELLDREKDLDAAIIATPDWVHAEQAIACMKAGLHVYCEKEMSNDVNKAREMVRASQETGKLLQIGRQRRSNPRYLFALNKIIREPNLLGTLTHAYAQWNRSVASAASVLPSKRTQPSEEVLKRYGYGSVEEFANWRWFRKFGGGPVCDLSAHQIDVLGWFLGSRPRKVVVNGGRDYWVGKGKTYEWYDNVRAIYEFPTSEGLVRAQCQVLTTTSAMGYFECFMGTHGTLSLSENSARCRVFPEGWLNATPQGEHPWAVFERRGYLIKAEWRQSLSGLHDGPDSSRLYYDESPPAQFLLGCNDVSTYHGPHLRNFFNAIRGKEKLNCPGEVGFECAVQVLKVNQLLDAGKDSGTFEESEFKV